MRPWLALMAAVLLSTAGCADRPGRIRANEQNVAAALEPAKETFALGTEVTPDGAVVKQSAGDNFIRGGEVYLSVDVSGASSDQTVEVRWVGPEGRVLRRDERKTTQGMHHIPFSSGVTSQWTPGEHRAVVLIDGRTVSQKAFALL